LQTYWLTPTSKANSAISGSSTGSDFDDIIEAPSQEIRAQQLLKREREIDWITTLLEESICQVVAKKDVLRMQSSSVPTKSMKLANRSPMDDVVEAIHLPDLSSKIGVKVENPTSVKSPDNIRMLLRQYVAIVSWNGVVVSDVFYIHFMPFHFPQCFFFFPFQLPFFRSHLPTVMGTHSTILNMHLMFAKVSAKW